MKDLIKEIFNELDSCVCYIEDQLDSVPDCFSALKEDISVLKDRYQNNTNYLVRREGRWKGAGFGDYYCSLCCSEYSGAEEYNYCPNCGAKMKE